jgi:hypothetical protein
LVDVFGVESNPRAARDGDADIGVLSARRFRRLKHALLEFIVVNHSPNIQVAHAVIEALQVGV